MSPEPELLSELSLGEYVINAAAKHIKTANDKIHIASFDLRITKLRVPAGKNVFLAADDLYE